MDYPKTLEQLREEQEKIKSRHSSGDTFTEVTPEYAEKLKGDRRNDMDSILAKVDQLVKRPQKHTPHVMLYDDAKVIVWRICQLLSAQQNRKFEVDDDNKAIMQNITRYFIGDPACDWNLSKGLLLMGDVGLGKSYIMKVVRTFAEVAGIESRQFRLLVCSDIADRVSEEGSGAMSEYFTGMDICFDDFGQEQPAISRYGNQISVMERILTKRYNSQVNGRCITHLTTNLTPEEIEERYGTRLIDRFSEMFNFVFMTGESRRK